MNIKFGMDNFLVRYLKRFLNHELTHTNRVLGKFDKYDLENLIKYLNLPNVKDMFEVKEEIIKKFPELNTSFRITLKNDSIEFVSKVISEEQSKFITENISNIKDFCDSVGWELDTVSEWVDLSKDINGDKVIDLKDQSLLNDIIFKDYPFDESVLSKADINLDGQINELDLAEFTSYLNTAKLSFEIKMSNRKNYFPNEDMKVFVNQFDGTFLYNYAFRDGTKTDDQVHENDSQEYKVALYKCKPGQKITIAHNCNQAVRVVIGCSSMNMKQSIKNDMLSNVHDIILKPGEGYQYTTASIADGTGYDANWVCIQVPSSYSSISGNTEKTVLLELGDVNFDGQIDLQDYMLLATYTATGPGSAEKNWVATEKQKLVMDIDRDGIPTTEDAVTLYEFIQHTNPTYPSLGVVAYTYNTTEDIADGLNVDNLLILDGHYDNSVNIPFNDFVEDDWVVHDKFFNYLLGMAIHKYSDSESISYLAELLKAYFPEHTYDSNYFYPGIYKDTMKELVKEYQESKSSFTLGDLNRDNRLSNEDLYLLRQYLDSATILTDEEKKLFDKDNSGTVTHSDYEALNKEKQMLRYYLDDLMIFTPEEQAYYDYNKDGKLDEEDFKIISGYVDKVYDYLQGLESLSPIQRTRADVNSDGYIDEKDYNLLEAEIKGESNTLRKYDIPFMLGWLDVQTEGLLETDVNSSGDISEVSK